jgi:uncharacterized membrane-anchored protein
VDLSTPADTTLPFNRPMAIRLAILLLPVIVLAALIGYHEKNLAAGDTWRIPIQGFDPRDLLKGHYLRFRLDLDRIVTRGSCPKDEECCLCLTLDESDKTQAQRLDCPAAFGRSHGKCGAVLREEVARGFSQYFIPEDRAQELDRILRGGRGGGMGADKEKEPRMAVEIVVDKQGGAVLKGLLLDGQPAIPEP